MTLPTAIVLAGFVALALGIAHLEKQRFHDQLDEQRSRARIREELRRQELRGDDRWWLS